jgi:hypothetical protein
VADPDTLAALLERLADDELAEMATRGARYAARLKGSASSADRAWSSVFAYLTAAADVALLRRSTRTKV